MSNFDRFGLATRRSAKTIELIPLHAGSIDTYRSSIASRDRVWLDNSGFNTKPDTSSTRHDRSGSLKACYVAIETQDDTVENPYDYAFSLAGWYKSLEPGVYEISDSLDLTDEQKYKMTLGWALAAYRFEKYKSKKEEKDRRLVIPKGIDKKALLRELEATFMVQDLINEPPNVMNVAGLVGAAKNLAKQFNAKVKITSGKDLLTQNYPLIHAVGKGAAEEPCLVDIRWGDPTKPCVTLVGKGVIFDVGGLNMKDADGMRDMKNDMSGAAHALGVAYMVMDAQLPVNIRVLLPIVENAATDRSYKQGDIYKARNGETIEIVNTDAEGRLIMADSLREASHPESGATPSLIIDFATLSWHGYSEFPGFGSTFSNDNNLQRLFLETAAANQEYYTGRPLMPRVGKELEASTVADLIQCSNSHPRYDDLLAAALLHRQVGNDVPWIHNDLQSWRPENDPTTAYPPHLANGGFAQGVRTAFEVIQQRFPELEV